MKTVTVKRVDILSVAKIYGLMMACAGIFGSLWIVLIVLVGSLAEGGEEALFGAAAGIALAIFFPLLYGIMGFVIALIGGLLYNLFARWIGGVRFDLEES
jgi:hypothetical protein